MDGRWHFELNGWWQIVLFDLLVLALALGAYWCGFMDGARSVR